MDYSILEKSPLFRGMNAAEIEQTLLKVHHRPKTFKAGEIIAVSGEPVERMHLVMKGITRGEMVDSTGRVIKIEDIPSPGALAPAFMFGRRNTFPVNVTSVTDVEILIIEKEDFLAMIMAADRILVNFLDMISNRSQFLSEKIKFLNFKTIRGKLAHYFLQKAGDGRDYFHLGLTQNEMADFFGVARPSIGRAIGELEEMDLIRADGKNITIIDRTGLAALTHG